MIGQETDPHSRDQGVVFSVIAGVINTIVSAVVGLVELIVGGITAVSIGFTGSAIFV